MEDRDIFLFLVTLLGYDVNQTVYGYRHTLLHLAIERGNFEAVNYLLEKGADVNKADRYERTPLNLAVQLGNLKIVNALVGRGADVNKANKCGNTPLHLAIERGNFKAVNALVGRGADVNQTDGYGRTPLHLAIEKGNFEAVNALVGRGADINKADNRGYTPLHFAAQIGNAEIINALISHQVGDDICTPLHLAVLRNDMELVNSLIERGVDVNKANKYGYTPLHFAIERGNFEAVNALISHQVGDDICTPLHLAVLRNDMELVNSLIEQGADVDEVSRDRYTPLHLAVQVGNVELINALIKRSADINRVDRHEHTVLHWAIKSNNIQVVNVLIERGADVNKANRDGYTPLHLAVQAGNVELINALIKRSADINRVDRHEHTVLYWAIKSNNIQVVNVLIERGADVNKANRDGFTPLHFAVEGGNFEVVNTLIERGADIKMDIGYPLNWAIHYGFQDIAELLIQHEVKLKGCNVRKPRYLVQHNSDLEREMSEYIDRCVNEIEGIKKEIINGNVTFYDLLTSKGNKLASLMRNKDIVTVLEKGEYKSKFPTYSKIMESQYEIGKKNLQLFDQALKVISNLFVVKNLPREINEMIVKYLPSSFDRKSLIELVKVKELPNEKVIERRSSLEHKTIPTTQTVQDILTQIRGILDNQQIEVNDLLTLEFATSAGYYDYWLQQIDIARAARLLYQLRNEGNHTFEVANLAGNDGNEYIVRVLNQFRENEKQQRLTLIITLDN
uniref:ankyrin repeat domain-containing protein n=1 Tax=Wolbachia endosymbiont of Cardiocondyla obscurior TaxID=2687307 RepID=UPI00157B1CA2